MNLKNMSISNHRKYDVERSDKELVNFLSNDHSYGELYSIAISYFNQKTDNNSRRPIVYHYPNHKDINSNLKKLVVDNATIRVQGDGKRTETKIYDCTDPEEINAVSYTHLRAHET